MRLRLFQVDAFADRVFSGNPAAVVPLETWLDEALMQRIANENNLAETAFFVGDDDAAGCFEIRWFTPATEVPLCGHATLASAAVIDRTLRPAHWPLKFRSASGELRVARTNDGFELDFPANEPEPVRAPPGLAEALGAEAGECLRTRDFYLLALASESAVAGLTPDFRRLREITDHGVIVTAPGERVDFVSRFFAPGIGIDEDPVTGAAHCALTPYWSRRLNKLLLSARQVSRRGGEVACESRGDRVLLTGRAAFYLEGTITLPAHSP
ncbi:MAG: PhzF family phenazine biosynthesis protein [Planctomycetaceae bacterium]